MPSARVSPRTSSVSHHASSRGLRPIEARAPWTICKAARTMSAWAAQ